MIKERTTERLTRGQAGALLLSGVSAFLLTGARFGEFSSPLQVSLAAVVSPLQGVAVLAGSLFASVTRGTLGDAPVLLCALVMIVLSGFVLPRRTSAGMGALAAAAGLSISAGLFFVIGGIDLADLALYLCMAVLAGVAAYFAAEALTVFRPAAGGYSEPNGCAFGVCFLLVTGALGSAQLWICNLGVIFAGFVILQGAKRYGIAGGTVCGVLASAGLMLCSRELGDAAAFLALSGMAAGYFADFHKGAVCLLFLAIQGAGQLLLGTDSAAILLLLNLAAGCLLYLALPVEGILEQWLPEIGGEEAPAGFAAVQMDYLAHALAGVRQNAQQIARMLERNGCRETTAQNVCEQVCRSCSRRLECWEERYEETAEAFRCAAAGDGTELPEALQDCARAQTLLVHMQQAQRQAALHRMLSARLTESQGFLFSQMELTEELLGTAGQRLAVSYSRSMTRKVTQLLEREGYPVHTAVAYRSAEGRLALELYAFADAAPDGGSVRDCLSDALGMELDYTEGRLAGEEVRICLWERPPYGLAVFAAQSSARDEEPPGDSYDQFSDGRGHQYLVLSDGMGSGRRASLDARLVLSNFRRLIEMGVSMQTAVGMVNQIMLTKSTEETFATLDIARISQETGETLLVKYGAAPTLIQQGQVVTMYQTPTFPIGIVGRPEAHVTRLRLEDSDVIVLMSDGVEESEYAFVKQKLLAGGSLQQAAQAICCKAQRSAADGRPDDITVLLAQVRRNTD